MIAAEYRAQTGTSTSPNAGGYTKPLEKAAPYEGVRWAFPAGARYKSMVRVVKSLEPYADRYGEIYKEVLAVHEKAGQQLSELGVYTSHSDILAEYSQLKRIARKKDPSGKARELLDELYQSARKKETYLEDLKSGVRISIEEKRVKKKDVVKATIPTVLEVFFDCIITAISPDIGYWFWLGTTAGFFGYPAVQWGEWVKTNREVKEDLRLLDELRPAQLEYILKSIDTYPEKVRIELARLEKEQEPRKHRFCRRKKLNKMLSHSNLGDCQ